MIRPYGLAMSIRSAAPARVVVALVIGALVVGACSAGSSEGRAVDDRAPSTTASDKVAMKPVGRHIDGTLRTPDGRVRSYHVYLPGTLPAGKAVPLLIGLHGGLGHGTQFEANSGFDHIADANRFIVVYPDGTPIPALPAGRVWNAGGCCAAAAEDRDDVDDVGYISALIDRLKRTYRIDDGRVFATGHSNGAMLSYRLACELSTKVVAIGVQSGALFQTDCHPTKAVSVLAIHGTADQNVPITGGVGTHALSGVAFPSPADGPATWARLDRCPAPTIAADPANRDVTTQAWAPCRNGTKVRWITVKGANHAWMGHPSASPASAALVGTPYQRFDSSKAIWAFLASVPRRTSSGLLDISAMPPALSTMGPKVSMARM